jgi:proline dehydrogenase
MLRQTLLALSHSATLQRLSRDFPPARRVARRFVAGEQREDALRVIRQLNDAGVLVTLDYLGEHVTEESEARACVAEYQAILADIARDDLQSGVSLKLSAMGLHIDAEFCYRNVYEVVETARSHYRFVRIDMEEAELVDITLDIYRRLRMSFNNVGIVLQAYLFRTRDDLRTLLNEGIADVRLVKGAYDESDEVAWQEREEIQRELISLSQMLLTPAAIEQGGRLALGSHDDVVYNAVAAFASAQNIASEQWEIQFLYGIRRDELQRLVQAGHRMRVYVPYGDAWYPYFIRRLAERPANLTFFLRALAGG